MGVQGIVGLHSCASDSSVNRGGFHSFVVMARSTGAALTVATATLLLAFLCTLAVADAALSSAVTPQRRILEDNSWQNPQVYSQKCPGDKDWYSTPPKNFWALYRRLCDPKRLPVNKFGNYSKVILNKEGISGFGTREMYYTGRFTIKLKLPPGNSSGTIFAYYMSSNGKTNEDHDEIDFEFLGNEPGKPIIMQTNIFINGMGNREMRHKLWFNPSAGYHEYSIIWNSAMVLFGVDSVPFRVFMNNERRGVPYLNKGQGLYVSHWDGSKWATQGGRIKIDYELNAPFVAEVKGFGRSINACRVPHERSVWSCKYPGPIPFCWEREKYRTLTENQKNLLRWVARDNVIYDYCQDERRWPQGDIPKPKECGMIPF